MEFSDAVLDGSVSDDAVDTDESSDTTAVVVLVLTFRLKLLISPTLLLLSLNECVVHDQEVVLGQLIIWNN